MKAIGKGSRILIDLWDMQTLKSQWHVERKLDSK
jgi:hypothetical protein